MLNLPKAPNIIQKIRHIPVPSLELPVGFVTQTNHNTLNKTDAFEQIGTAKDFRSSCPSSSSGNEMLGIVRTNSIIPGNGLTILPSTNTPKMSVIALDNSQNLAQQQQNENCYTRLPLRQMLKQNLSGPLTASISFI